MIGAVRLWYTWNVEHIGGNTNEFISQEQPVILSISELLTVQNLRSPNWTETNHVDGNEVLLVGHACNFFWRM